MSKKILFMSSAKLTAISIGLLLAVFCTIGMSFRPVYDENEAEEIVMSGPRRSHWTTAGSCGSTDYHNKTDYAKTVAQSMNVAYGTVAITANTKNATPVTAADGSQSYVEWDSGIGASETSNQRSDLEAIHTNTITFTATPTDPEEYKFVGWYSDAGGTSLVSDKEETPWQKDVKFDSKYYTYNSGSHANTEYENASKRWTVTYYAKFEPIPSTNVTFLAASTPTKDNGSYTVVGKGVNSTITTSNQVIPVKSITLTATPSEATEFLNWYKLGAGDEKIILSTENPFTTSFTEETTVGVEWRELKNNLNITFKAVEKDANGNRKGSYTVDGVTVSATDYVHFTGSTYKYRPTLVATPATGYGFKGWYVKEAGAKKYLSTEATWNATITDEVTIYADFVYVDYPAESLAQFKVGSTYYTDLNAANTAAKSASKKVIVCTRDGYLLPGNYTISSGVSLLIPYSSDETVRTTPALIEIPSPAPLPNAYRTLTMLDGADIICEGTICVSGQMISHQGGNATGCPGGDLGVINMANGGHIELKSGATLYAWGFIKGQDKDQGNNTTGVGTITANNGATVWENIAFGDWRGGSQTFAAYECSDTYRSFPFQSYSIQNIEVPLSLKFGATENVYTALYIPTAGTGSVPTAPTLISNSGALFLLKDSKSIVRKWYDPTTDLVCYELSGTAQLNELSITVSISIASRTINSSSFDLPICSNMHIILTNCDMTLSKPMTMHAGSVIEIKPDATVTIASNLHIFDLDQFDMFAYSKYYMTINNLTSHKYRGTGTTKEYIDDAKLIVDGTLKVTGGIYTTANGANIMGNGGGKVIFQSALPGEKNIWFLKGGASGTQAGGTLYHFNGILGQGKADIYLTPYAVNAANLCNEDGTYTKSSKNTFYNVHGRWFIEGKQNEQANHTHDFTYMASGNSGDNVNTPAVYSHDRTGLEPRMKWFNVSVDGCTDWWVDGSSRLYNWTKFSDWHQFIPTEVTDMYGCSNGSLYNKISCTEWEELGGTDENCLYTIGGVKKALVGTTFIEMEPNSDDAAYHRKGADTEYYISFDGCIWHPATKIEDEKKAYTVEEQQFIWFEGGWLNVTREEPFFYSVDELNVKTYYEYVGSEWIIAEPYVRVSTDDPTQTRALLSLNEAVAVANSYKNPTITILRDIPAARESAVYTAANTTCTLDLNGHTVTSVCQYMLNINATGSTFIIKDKTSDKKGELRACPEGGNARTIGYQVTKGTLKLESGKMYSTNTTTRTGGTAETFTSATNTGVVVKANAVFTVTGGTVESEDEHQPYAVKVETNGTMNLSGTGEIKAHATKWYSTRGVSLENGNLNMSGGSILSSAIGASTVYGVVVGASASWNAAKSTSSSSYGTLTLTGGTITARTPKDARGVQVSGAADVTGDYNESPIDQTVKLREYGRCNISGGSINAEATTSTTAFGILSYGTTSITGGNITANVLTSSQSTAYGVRVDGGVTTINGSANIVANAPTVAYGVLVQGVVDGNRGWCHYGELNIKGGTITANTTNKTKAYGLYVTATTKNLANTNSYSVFNGDYAAHGTAIITGGHFYANARTTTAIGIDVEGTKTLNAASATPVCTINGGYFKMTGTGDTLACNTAALPANFQVNAGYYSHKGNLATYAVSPKQVVTLPKTDTNRPDYQYKVAEAYTITFKNGDTQLQSSYQEVGKTPVYEGDAPTKASTTTTSYVFDGWSTTDGGALVAPLPAVTSAGATYYAHFAETTLKYIATFDAKTNGGNEDAQVIYVEPAAGVGTLPTATKTGYTFNGWYTAASGGAKITSATVPTGDVTYFAQFSVNSYTLTWNLDGGTVSTAGKYGSTSWPAKNATGAPSVAVPYGSALTAPAVTKTGYTFVNWGGAVAATMPAEALTYTATWRANTNTKYTVKHYQQNIADDGYTEVTEDRQSLTGTTGASVTPAVKSYDGFLKPAAQTTTIAANGSTVVEYRYDRVEYSIKWNAYANGGTCATPSSTVRHGATLGSMPTATKTGLRFDGWYTQAVGGVLITGTTPIMQNYGTLYAQFVELSDIGFWADIVDVDNSANTLTLNVTGWASSGWPYTVNEVVYEKGNRKADRTLIIPYTGEVGATFAITVTNKNSVIVSKHNYIIPAEITSSVNLVDQQYLYVKSSATLTVNANKTVKNIYVAPGAKLVVNAGVTLKADTVFLRTTPWESAELELNGTITGQVCYTRIISKKDAYYQFGLPMPCKIADVRLSDGTKPVYGNGWLLRSYSESSRAQNGTGTDIDNWVTLTSTGSDEAEIQGRTGYEMFSNSGYYREYYFPVAHTDLASTVDVTRTTENTKGETHEGWNIKVSPLMRKYTVNPAPEGLVFSWLREEGDYEQLPVTEVKPAIPFSYQAKASGNITFGNDITVPSAIAARRVAAAEEPTRIQWIHLDIEDEAGIGDQTSIYSHPTRYEQTYQTGIDVAKQSLTASRAIIYSSHAYGDMAFAGVADTLLESGVALTVYSPVAQELTFSLRDNDWLNRMEYVWLIDNETGAKIDLLSSDYSYEAAEGTTRGRFFIQGQFKAPQIATDIQNGQSGEVQSTKARKLMINQKIFIEVNGRLYDATGKEVKR